MRNQRLSDPAQCRFRCPACGFSGRVPCTTPRIYCACGYAQLNGIRAGLGDHLAAALHRLGITRRRYVAVKRSLGLRPVCRCGKRQAALNRWGWALRFAKVAG